MLLVIGPSCAGKSTYITRLRAEAADRGETLDVGYAFEVAGEDGRIADGPRDVLHVNLLRGYQKRDSPRISVKNNRLVPSLVQAADEVLVLAAPRSVLKARAAARTKL